MHDIKEIQEHLDELRDGLNDLGKVCRDYVLMIAFIDEKNLDKEYEDFAKGILNEIRNDKTDGGSDGKEIISDLSEGPDSGINSEEESGL